MRVNVKWCVVIYALFVTSPTASTSLDLYTHEKKLEYINDLL